MLNYKKKPIININIFLLFISLLIFLMVSCSSNHELDKDKSNDTNTNLTTSIKDQKLFDRDFILNMYYQYAYLLENDDYDKTLSFLSKKDYSSYLQENIRIKFLKKIADDLSNKSLFLSEYNKLSDKAIDNDLLCYKALVEKGSIFYQQHLRKLLSTNDAISKGCYNLILDATLTGSIDNNSVWSKIWRLLANNNITYARNLASAINQPLQKSWNKNINSNANNAMLMYSLFKLSKSNYNEAGRKFEEVKGYLTEQERSFVYGVLAYNKAKNLEMQTALEYFKKANSNLFTLDEWEWYARSALRLQNWSELNNIINKMPSDLKEKPAWLYWYAKSKEHINRGKNNNILSLYDRVSKSGRNFYAILANEELGRNLNIKNNVSKANARIKDVLRNTNDIHIALTLFQQSLDLGDRKLRSLAQNQWKYAVRNFNEQELLISSEVALENNFYEMAIYSAEQTLNLFNFNLRYLSPYKELITRYSNLNSVDRSWVYGIIRQESRFMNAAKSSAGASGLMQVMPGTARYISKKSGIALNNINDLDTNINMGTWYLSYNLNSLGNKVLATAAYNAGPGRAKKWQDYVSLDPEIYIETVPFNETRDYIKKVLTNHVYYGSIFNDKNSFSLKKIMGQIPAKQ